jgi:large subunit ribosomal protein L6
VSRIGSAPIPVPSGVVVDLSSDSVSVRGPLGVLERTVPFGITVSVEDQVLVVKRADDERRTRALHGLTRALVNNMVLGVTEGFSKHLELVGVGYRAIPKGQHQLELALGFSHPVVVDAPEGVTFEVPAPNRVKVTGIDKEAVGQVAADIRKLRKPEPYKGKGVRYAGETILRKAGKAAK